MTQPSAQSDSGMDLYASDIVAMKKIMVEVQRNHLWRNDADDISTMVAIRDEIQSKFAEIGFRAEVDFESAIDYETGQTFKNPTIVDIVRLDTTHDFDHNQMAHEVQSGMLDGVEGTIREDGTWAEHTGIL